MAPLAYAPLRAFNQDTLLPELERRVRERRKVNTIPYGNFVREFNERSLTDTVKHGWETYDSHARFGTNYYGLRGKLSVLSEAYSHDPFEKRVESTYAFVRELLSLVAEQGPAIEARTRRSATPSEGVLRARLTTAPRTGPVISEVLVRAADTTALTEPGVPRGYQRTGRFLTQSMPIYDRFEATLRAPLPAGGWAFGAEQERAARVLRLHGVRVERADSASGDVDVQVFRADSVVRAPRPFQGHNEIRLEGSWHAERLHLEPGGYFVPASQPLALVAQELLEPQSDDGLATWNYFDPLQPGTNFPVVRLAGVPNNKRTPMP